MAALSRHRACLRNAFRSAYSTSFLRTTNARRDVTRYTASDSSSTFKNNSTLESTKQSIASKGFLRPIKPYDPPYGVDLRIDKICKTLNISVKDDTKLQDDVVRFNILKTCADEFKHSVPNSLLHTIETIGDLKMFYKTPVDCATPLDALKRIELPKNLHVQHEYVRFHPDTDTMFNGKTAFPLSSTIVTGLKYKKKYPGHKQQDPFYHIYKQTK